MKNRLQVEKLKQLKMDDNILSKENAIILEDALVWLRDEKRIIDIARPLNLNGLELAKYITEYKKVKENKLFELADKIINDCNLYLGANLVNGEIEQYKKLRNENKSNS